ncbi:MAG: sulfate transporter CysZ [Gammaproteobacteria bacterium]|nr:sulfate transporter CysZ [Gammaproteobacteria bacterium]
MSPFVTGARCFFQGFSLIARPGLKRYVIVPLLINMAVFAGLIGLAGSAFIDLLNNILPELPEWLAWLAWLLWLLFAALVAIVIFYTFTLVANLIGAPFNSHLAKHVEIKLTGSVPPAADESLVKGLWRDLSAELRKLAYFLLLVLPVAVLSLMLLFIPVVNGLIPFIWFIFGSWMLALEYADYPLANHGLRFSEQRSLLRIHRLEALGFGAAATLATMIPGINFFVMPAAVAGATCLWSGNILQRSKEMRT